MFDWPVFFVGRPRQYLGSCSCLLSPWKEVVIRLGHVACSHSHFDTNSHRRGHRHTCAKEALLNLYTHVPTPSPEWPSGRACLCQQMSGRRCVFLCLLLYSFHLLLQRLPICLWSCFIAAHFTPHPHPMRMIVHLLYYRHCGIVYCKKTPKNILMQ